MISLATKQIRFFSHIGVFLQSLFVLSFLVGSQPAHAQNDPRQFFDRGFVERGGGSTPTPSKLSTPTSKEVVGEKNQIPPELLKMVNQRPLLTTLVVNSKDAEHLVTVLKNAITSVRERRLVLPIIYHVGDYRTLPNSLQKELDELQIAYLGVTSVPYVEDPKQSPLWIFMRSDGIDVLEGALSIEGHIDEFGQIIVPKLQFDFLKPQDGKLKEF